MTDKQIILSLTRELEAATKPKWVKTIDQLPPFKTHVLIYGKLGCEIGFMMAPNRKWLVDGIAFHSDEFPYWQPLPPAPECE